MKTKIRKDRRRIRQIANKICARLNSEGYHVMRYDSKYSTYLTVDGGVLCSIRISNHVSKKKNLKYRYNILLDLEGEYVSRCDNFIKYYFGVENLNTFFNLVKCDRNRKINKYGERNYKILIFDTIRDKKNNSQQGFWKLAKTVKNIKNNKEINYYDGIYFSKSLIKAKRQN